MSILKLNSPDIVFVNSDFESGQILAPCFPEPPKVVGDFDIPSRFEECYSIAVVRHPFDRFLSTFLSFQDTLEGADIDAAISLLNCEAQDEASKQFRNLLHPQTRFQNRLYGINRIMRYETLFMEYKELRKEFPKMRKLPYPTAPRTDYQDVLTPMQKNKLVSYYEDDFDRLGYQVEYPTATDNITDWDQFTPEVASQWPAFFGTKRILVENVEQSLPAEDCDLELFNSAEIEYFAPRHNMHRLNCMVKKYHKLLPEFSRQSWLSFLLACSIAAVRRSGGNSSALSLFFRIMNQYGAEMAGSLSLRWLISVCDTFADWGETPQQRAIGFAGSSIGNAVKLYETELRIYHPSRSWPPKKKFGHGGVMFDGLETFYPQKGDTLDNLLQRAFDISQLDQKSGGFLLEILARIMLNKTAMSRMEALKGTEETEIIDSETKRYINDLLRKEI